MIPRTVALMALVTVTLLGTSLASAQSAPIDSPEVAARLARAIYADMAEYDCGPLDGVPPERVRIVLAGVLRTARALFESRVTPSLRQVFDDQYPFLVHRVVERLRVETPASSRALAELLLADAARAPDDERTITTARALFRSRAPSAHHAMFDELAAPG